MRERERKYIFLKSLQLYMSSQLLKIQLLESPIPVTTAVSQKASSDDISGTKRGTIDPLVSKQPEKFWKRK